MPPAQVATFQVYYEELITWNQRVNLTAITDLAEVQVKHFLDSLTCLLAIPLPLPLPYQGRGVWPACADLDRCWAAA